MDDVPKDDIVADAAEEFQRGTKCKLTVATEVWVVTALLHRQHPGRADFATTEIIARAQAEAICGPLRSGFAVHVNQHCVANRPPNPARLRILVETGRGRRRLFRPGDPYDPQREGGKTMPDRGELPANLSDLLDWYDREYASAAPVGPAPEDPILGLRGRGVEIRGGENADEHVRRLREDWA